ncbi:MAG: amidohydrolase family protein [Elusimicrobia bacterium]|nr:amidohydrolase family protein [Elusimicrobiota bacterium]
MRQEAHQTSAFPENSTEFFGLGPYRPVEPLPPGLIDMHCHVAGLGGGGSGCFVSAELRDNWRFGLYLRSFGVSRKELLEKGDSLIAGRISEALAGSKFVGKAVLLAMDGAAGSDGSLDADRTEIYVPNEFVAEAAARHANLLFGASVNPYRKDALKRLEWAKEHGAVLVKWLPSIMAIDPADPKLVPFYQKLVELKLPLLTHTGKERSFSSSNDELCDPDKLRLPLSLGVTVIAAHIASTGKYHGERSVDRLARLMPEYPNLYSDISSLTQLNKLFYMKKALTRPEFSGRLLYGSDFPLINTALVSPWYYFPRLTPKRIAAVLREKNPWDRDVLIKQWLGTPAEIFDRPRRMFGQ